VTPRSDVRENQAATVRANLRIKLLLTGTRTAGAVVTEIQNVRKTRSPMPPLDLSQTLLTQAGSQFSQSSQRRSNEGSTQ